LFCLYVHRDIVQMSLSVETLRKAKYPFKKLWPSLSFSFSHPSQM
jgi:hypothetical protein